MQFKPLCASLIGIGLLSVGIAQAVEWPRWLQSDSKVAAASPPSAATVVAQPVVPMMNAQGLVPNYRAIVKQYGPAVVGLTVEGSHKNTPEELGLPPGFENDPFFQFFRGLPGYQQRGRDNPSVPFRGQGSGFIISADGLILTNAHVVRDAKEVTVKLSDRREYSAKVLGSDKATDVAVLRIEAKGLPLVRLGDASQLEVGDPVLAIGAPFGLEQSATQGIVSAKGRSLPGETVVPFIQTDAAVNPGNSGGPLFDGSGAVVGINAQIYSRSGGYQGLSFAIPINVALKIKDQIVATGKASHARLGVSIQDLTQPLAQSFGLDLPDGALVAAVVPRSAAAAAGLKSGDVVVAVNGEPIVRSGSLSSLIGMMAPGERVKLKIWRDRTPMELEVKLGTAEEGDVQEASAASVEQTGQLGLSLRALTREERTQTQIEQGLVIEGVTGAAARAGIEAGDVLLAINGKPVQSVDQVKGLLRTKAKTVALLVLRDGEKIFVPVSLG